jgi:hypothetical protein
MATCGLGFLLAVPPLHILSLVPIVPTTAEKKARWKKAPAPVYYKNVFMENAVSRPR